VGPVLEGARSIRDSVATLVAMADIAYATRNMPGMMELARETVRVMGLRKVAADAAGRRPRIPERKVPLLGLAELLHQGVGVGSQGRLTSTRCMKIVRELQGTPAYGPLVPSNNGLAAAPSSFYTVAANGTVGTTDNPRDAANAMEAFLARQSAFPSLEILQHLDTAKNTPSLSLRDHYLVALRRILPDFGAPLVLAAMESLGFEDDHPHRPNSNFIWSNFVLLTWAENTMADLRRVLEEQNLDIRGECFSPLVEGPDGAPYTSESYGALVRKVNRIRTGASMTDSARREATAVYQSDTKGYDEANAQYRALQRTIDQMQAEALLACDSVLTYIRHIKADKTMRQDHEAATGTGRAAEGRAPDRRGGRGGAVGSAFTPGDAVRRAIGAGADFSEVGMSVPRYDAEALGLTEVARKKSLAVVGMDGGRVCSIEAYEGVVWEAVLGPYHHAFDFLKEDGELQFVLIAPRRVDGPGVDMEEARVIMVTEFEEHFLPIEEEEA
jgi:hypothetical protein